MRAASLFGFERRVRRSTLLIAALLLPAGMTARSMADDAIERGPSSRRSERTISPPHTPPPVLIAPGERVRIHLTDNPERVPPELRGKLVGSITGMNHENLTVVLADGAPAVIHRDLVTQFDREIDLGSRSKHVLVGGLAGAAYGALFLALLSGSYGEVQGQAMLSGGAFFGAVGVLVGAIIPAGERWVALPFDRLQLNAEPKGAPQSGGEK